MALKGPSITPVITNTIDKVIHYKNAELAKKEEEHNARIAELKAVQLKNPISQSIQIAQFYSFHLFYFLLINIFFFFGNFNLTI